MRISRSIALGVIGLVSVGCSDTTSPRPASGYYVLESVNGQPLPAVIGPIPEESISVLFGYLALDDDSDNALTVELRRELDQNVPRETHYTSTFNYEIEGNTIELFPHCDETAFCGSIDGVISGDTVSLTIALTSQMSFTYVYRRAELPENWSPGL